MSNYKRNVIWQLPDVGKLYGVNVFAFQGDLVSYLDKLGNNMQPRLLASRSTDGGTDVIEVRTKYGEEIEPAKLAMLQNHFQTYALAWLQGMRAGQRS